MPWPLIGRDDEVASALAALRSPGTAVVLVGPAGVGKSRLAAALLAELDEEGLDGRRVAGTATGVTTPFGAFGPLLWSGERPALAATPAVGSGEAVAHAASIVHALAPALALLVDDGQWLDDASAMLVHQLAAQGRTRLIITIRAGEAVPDAVTAIWKDLDGLRLDLAALSEQDTEALLRRVLGGPLQPQASAMLYATSGGNPLFLRELVLESVSSGRLVRQRGAWRLDGPLAAGARLHDLIRHRLELLAPDTAEVVRLVAFGEPLPWTMVAAAGSLDALDRAEERAVVTSAETPVVVRMAHPIYREIVREATGAAASLRVHGVLDAAATDAIDPIRRVLWWLASPRLRPLPIEVVLAAATDAQNQGVPELVFELLEATPESGADRADVALLRGHALFATSQEAAALEQFALAASAAIDDAQRAEAAAATINALVYGFSNFEAAARVLAEAEVEMKDDGALDLVRSRFVSMVALAGGRPDATQVHRLLDHPNPRVRLGVFPAGSQLLLAEGRVDDAVALAEAHLAPALELLDELPDALTTVFSALVTNNLMAGNLDAVAGLVDQARAMGSAVDQKTAALVDLLEARLALLRGAIATASERLHRCLVVMEREMPHSTYTTWALSLQVECTALLGDTEGAGLLRTEAEARSTFEVALIALDAERGRAWATAAALDRSGAARALVELAQRCRAAGHPLLELQCLYDGCRLGAPASARDRLVELAANLQGRWAPLYADHLVARRDHDAAMLESVATRFEAAGAIPYAVDAAVDAAAAHRAAGRVGDGNRARSRAERLGDSCQGARPLSLLTGEAPTSRVALTARELEVAQLAATGLTSREIADKLFVSPRTVDNQLGRIYMKLGITGRGSLVAALAAPVRLIGD